MSKPEFEASLRAEVEAIVRARLGDMEKTLAKMHQQVEEAFSALRSESASRMASVGDDSAIASLAERTVAQLTAASLAPVPVPVPVPEPTPVAAEPAAPSVDLRQLRSFILEIQAQQTQADVLNLLVSHAAAYGPRVALFIVKAGNVVGWASRGFEEAESNALRGLSLSLQSDTLLRAVLEKQDTLTAGADDHPDNRLLLERIGEKPAEISGVPLLVRGKAAAVLYVDSGAGGETHLSPIEILVNIAGFTVELISARSRAASTVAPTTTGVPAVAASLTQSMPAPVAEEAPAAVEEAGAEPEAVAEPVAEVPEPEPAPEPEVEVEAAAEPEAEAVAEAPAPEPEPVAAAPEFVVEPEPPAPMPEFVVTPEPPAVEETAPEPVAEEKPVITHSFGAVPPPESEQPDAEPEAPPETGFSFQPEPVDEPVRPEPSFELPPTAVEPEPQPETGFAVQPEPPSEPARPETGFSFQADPPAPAAPVPGFAVQSDPERPAPSFNFQPDPLPEPPSAPEPESSPDTGVGFNFVPPTGRLTPPQDFSTTQNYSSFMPPGTADLPPAFVPQPPVVAEPAPVFTPPPMVAESAPTFAPPPVVAEPAPTFTPPPVAAEPAPAHPAAGNVQTPPAVPEEDQKAHSDARRFARLLVSEIKLYNEQKVVEGRQNNDLYDRLREDIDRSRQMYDKRITNPVVVTKFDYFYDEMVASLAEGDATKLGRDCPGPQLLQS